MNSGFRLVNERAEPREGARDFAPAQGHSGWKVSGPEAQGVSGLPAGFATVSLQLSRRGSGVSGRV